MQYTGSCHCGNVKFEVEGEITGALVCNCSICQRKGARMAFFPRSALTVAPAALSCSMSVRQWSRRRPLCPFASASAAANSAVVSTRRVQAPKAVPSAAKSGLARSVAAMRPG